jgi:tetratricopeptide (TPR) repeat protein
MNEQNLEETSPIPVSDDAQENLDIKENLDVQDITQDSIPLDETTPISIDLPEPEGAETPKKKRSLAWLWWSLSAIIVLAAVLVVSGMLGYQSGIEQRTSYEETQVILAIDEQYQLGLVDMEAGRYEVARQRFEYVIEHDPGYPGATDQLAEVMLIQNVTATPTLAPTPTVVLPTPTPDMRGELELYTQAQDHIHNEEWDQAITTLETLRKKNPEYQAINVDGMFFVALRNRGVKKIGLGQLEGGIYDLTLAESFGFLDTEADSWRTWARYYITGASFWDIDWGNAVYYFEQVANMTPNLQDGSGWTAAQRYLEALIKYAGYLEEQKDWCGAAENYDLAYNLGGDKTIMEARDFADEKCDGGSQEEMPQPPPPEENPTQELEATAEP